MAEVRLESDLRRVLRLLAARSCAELVIADLARDAELSRETTANYVALLEALYLVTLIPPWATSSTTRAKRRPKITLVDTGLAADLVGVGEATFAPSADGVLAGALFETLVVTEVFKQASWSQRPVEVSHFRDRDGAEIDLVVELTSTPLARHARHLARMRERLGARFSVGLVIHAGRVTLPLGAGIWAVPISALWRHDQ